MTKIAIGLFAGIFVGAVAYELLCRINPELAQKCEEMAGTLCNTATTDETP